MFFSTTVTSMSTWSVRAGDRRRLHVDVGLEIAEPLDPHLRALDPRAVVPRTLELPHFAPDDLVARLACCPLMLILRMYTRRPGSMKIVNATCSFSRLTSGTALTLAKAKPSVPRRSLIALVGRLQPLA